MSATAAMARIGQLEQLVDQLRGIPPSSQAAPSASFADALQSATSSSPVATAASAALATPAAAPGAATPYDGLIAASAQRNGVDPSLLKALIRQESGFDANARSGAGAVGLTQLMPSTAAGLGVGDPTDPSQAIEGGARYLREQLDAFGGDEAKALAAYNAGPGAVRQFGGVPPYAETQAYVQHVLAYAQGYRSQSPSPTPLTT